MRNWIIILLSLLLAAPVGMASTVRDDDDKDPSIRPGIRRLHPQRERAKAIKKLQEQLSRKADSIADPWDTTDDLWGTVDLPRAMRDSAAVEGHRLNGNDSRRMTWRDEPVTATAEQLLPFMALVDGEYRSRYVSGDSVANEMYFAFDVDADDHVAGPLRLCVRYCGNAKVDYDQIVFTIDSHDYFFYPTEPRNGKTADGQCWTASDDELQPAYRDLVYALAHGNWVMAKLQGTGGVNRIKVLSDGQRDDFNKTLALYRLMGGTL